MKDYSELTPEEIQGVVDIQIDLGYLNLSTEEFYNSQEYSDYLEEVEEMYFSMTGRKSKNPENNIPVVAGVRKIKR